MCVRVRVQVCKQVRVDVSVCECACSISVWQHVQLSEQMRPWHTPYTLVGRHAKKQTNQRFFVCWFVA